MREMFEEIRENKNIVFSSKSRIVNEWDNNIFYNSFDVFSGEIISDLKKSCDKHFIYNSDSDENKSDEHTIDGLIDCNNFDLFDLTSNLEDQSKEECWNAFTLRLKSEILEYAQYSEIDLEKVRAISCSASRLIQYKNILEYEQYDPYKDMEYGNCNNVEKIFSVIYYLKIPPNEKFGIIIKTKECHSDQIEKNNFYLEYVKENSFFIFNSSLPHSYIIPSPEELEISPICAIVFDFFIDDSTNHPSDISYLKQLSRVPSVKNIPNLKKNRNILYTSKSRTVNEWDNNIFYNVFNVFSEEIISNLKESCDKHFIHNVIIENPKSYFEFTETIIDCHGLSLTPSLKYPYEEEWWNIFVLKAKKEVLKYAQFTGIDPKKVAPFAVWSYRIIEYLDINHYINHNPYINMKPTEDGGIEKGKKMIGLVYYLTNPNENFGILVNTEEVPYNNVKSEEINYYVDYGKENSFFIFDASLSHSFVPPSPEDLKISPAYVIVFNFFINEPYSRAAWEDTIF
jgi:hypothetical protein